MLNFDDMLSMKGLPVPFVFTGDSFFVDFTNGDDSYDGKTPATPKKTLAAGYDLLTAGRGDTLYILGFGSGTNLTTGFTWAKNYTNMIGLCAPVPVSQRARITQLAAATAVTSLFTVNAVGCVFSNFQIFHGVADATSLVACKLTSTAQRNYFRNVHFAGIGNATMSAAGSASLWLNGASENCFDDCTIGIDTIARDADATEILFDTAATRNYFRNCRITSYLSAAGFASVTVSGATGIDRYQFFENCWFMAKSTNKAISQTEVFKIPAISQGAIVLKDSYAFSDGGAVDWDSNNRGIIWNNSVAAAASAAGGIMTNQ